MAGQYRTFFRGKGIAVHDRSDGRRNRKGFGGVHHPIKVGDPYRIVQIFQNDDGVLLY